MKSKKLRVIIPLLVMLVVAVGFGMRANLGTLSAIGWGDVSILCPLGALGTMLASKTVLPRAVVSLVLAVAAIIVLGRAFCAWVCPVPLVSKLRNLFSAKKTGARKPAEGGKGTASARGGEKADDDEPAASAARSSRTAAAKASRTAANATAGQIMSVEGPAANEPAPLTKAELASLKGCAHEKFDSRHLVLAGALGTAAVFGFPVFCLICPIGLTFAAILLVMLLFSGGDVTWSVVLVPVLLLVEVVFFRKWCSTLCPLSAFMSLIGKANRTFRPTIDDAKCLETAKGARCERCAQNCEVGINPRKPELGASWSECTKCRACLEGCPADAISMPLIARGDTVRIEAEPPAAKAD